MKFPILILSMLSSCHFAAGQVLIHSHNDYLRQRPFLEAVEARAFSVEADIFLVDSTLLVAHTPAEIRRSNTLERLYLEPIFHFLQKQINRGQQRYMPVVMVDIKEDERKVLPLLQAKLAAMQERLQKQGVDTMPLFVVSGERPAADSFATYPYYIQFDGRPHEQYDSLALSKIAFISDQYLKYSSWTGNSDLPLADSATIVRLVQAVHRKGKKLRLWNTPDNALAWSALHRLGVDIINTDQPEKCRAYFSASSPGISGP